MCLINIRTDTVSHANTVHCTYSSTRGQTGDRQTVSLPPVCKIGVHRALANLEHDIHEYIQTGSANDLLGTSQLL